MAWKPRLDIPTAWALGYTRDPEVRPPQSLRIAPSSPARSCCAFRFKVQDIRLEYHLEKRGERCERQQLRIRERLRRGRREPGQTPMIWMSMVRGLGPSSSARRMDWKRPSASSPPLIPTATLRPSSAARRCEVALPRSQSE